MKIDTMDKGIDSDLDGLEDRILAKSGEICRQVKITKFFKVTSD